MTVREDSIAAFYDEKLIVDPKDSIGCGNLYKSYQGYCDESGLKSKSIKNFTPSLLELCNDSLGHSIAHEHTRDGKVIKGLRFRKDGEIEDNNSITTGEKYLSSLTIKNQNSSQKLKEGSHPSPPIPGADCDPSQTRHDPSHPSQTTQGDLKQAEEPELEVKKNENGEIISF